MLPDWPAGLVLHTTLQGDVVQRADPQLIDAGTAAPSTPFWDEPWLRALAGETVPRREAARRRAAAHLDSLARVLGVAGWPDAAHAARRLRDETLAGVEAAALRARFELVARRVRSSRILRWMTGGLGRLDATTARAYGVAGPAFRAGGDVTSRLLQWLYECAGALEGADDERPLGPHDTSGPRGRVEGSDWPSQGLVDVLPTLLEGTEFARARLVVASLDPDPHELVGQPATREVTGG